MTEQAGEDNVEVIWGPEVAKRCREILSLKLNRNELIHLAAACTVAKEKSCEMLRKQQEVAERHQSRIIEAIGRVNKGEDPVQLLMDLLSNFRGEQADVSLIPVSSQPRPGRTMAEHRHGKALERDQELYEAAERLFKEGRSKNEAAGILAGQFNLKEATVRKKLQGK